MDHQEITYSLDTCKTQLLLFPPKNRISDTISLKNQRFVNRLNHILSRNSTIM